MRRLTTIRMAAFAALDRCWPEPWAEIENGFAVIGLPEPVRFAADTEAKYAFEAHRSGRWENILLHRAASSVRVTLHFGQNRRW